MSKASSAITAVAELASEANSLREENFKLNGRLDAALLMQFSLEDALRHANEQLQKEFDRTRCTLRLDYNVGGSRLYDLGANIKCYRITVQPHMLAACLMLTNDVAHYSDERIKQNVDTFIDKIGDGLRDQLTAEYKKARDEARFDEWKRQRLR